MSHINKPKEIIPKLQAMAKSNAVWPIGIILQPIEKKVGRWREDTFEISGVTLNTEHQQHSNENHWHVMNLQLYRDERSDYRFNLSSSNPKLFIIVEQQSSDAKPKLVAVTASQTAVGNYLDGEYLVLSTALPLPIQAWMEAFIGRHGELLELGRKKRKGAGRSNEQ